MFLTLKGRLPVTQRNNTRAASILTFAGIHPEDKKSLTNQKRPNLAEQSEFQLNPQKLLQKKDVLQTSEFKVRRWRQFFEETNGYIPSPIEKSQESFDIDVLLKISAEPVPTESPESASGRLYGNRTCMRI